MLEKKEENELINLCQKLIRIKSYSGEEKEVADFLKDIMINREFDKVEFDEYGDVIGYIDGNKPGPTILFDGHIDTVSVNENDNWIYPPFAGEIHDEKIYGRGASDMKGAVAAMVSAIAKFKKDNGNNFSGRICFAGVTNEECFEGVASRRIDKMVNPDYVIIGEASNLNLKIGQRGRAEVVVESFGKPCHSSEPQNGINAVYNMMKAVEAIRNMVSPHHEVLGDGILELTDIKSLPYPGASVVPSYCRCTYDRRLLPGESKDDVLKKVNDVLEDLMKQDSSLKFKASYRYGKERCYTGNTIESERFFPGWLQSEKSDFISKIYNQLKEMGYKPTITKYNFCTNGSHYAGEAGINTIGIGPSKEKLAHIVNEYIEISQLTGAMECYYGAIQALLK